MLRTLLADHEAWNVVIAQIAGHQELCDFIQGEVLGCAKGQTGGGRGFADRDCAAGRGVAVAMKSYLSACGAMVYFSAIRCRILRRRNHLSEGILHLYGSGAIFLPRMD